MLAASTRTSATKNRGPTGNREVIARIPARIGIHGRMIKAKTRKKIRAQVMWNEERLSHEPVGSSHGSDGNGDEPNATGLPHD